jgi:hypothetical protein
MSRAEEYVSLQEELDQWLHTKYKGMTPQSSMLPILRLKEVHELITKQKHYAHHGKHVSTANLKQIRELCTNLIDLSYEIQEIVLTHEPSLTDCKY